MGLLSNILDLLPRLFLTRQGFCLVKTVKNDAGALVRVMQIGGAYQSATYVGSRRFEPVFSYFRGFDLAFDYSDERSRLLMIGGGGFAWPKHVLSSGVQVNSLDVIEIDPVITRVARSCFYLGEAERLMPGVLRVYDCDGRHFIKRSEENSYVCVVLDAFCGSRPVASLATVDFAFELRKILAPSGAVLANVVSAEEGSDISFLRDFAASLGTVFSNVYAVLCEQDEFAVEDNYILVATDSSYIPDDALVFDADTFGTPVRDSDL